MKVLVIGSGGREHALLWKLSQSPSVTDVYVVPGNDGMSDVASLIPIKEMMISLTSPASCRSTSPSPVRRPS